MFKVRANEKTEWYEREDALTVGNLRRAKRDLWNDTVKEVFIEIPSGIDSAKIAFNLPGFVPAGCSQFVRDRYPNAFGVVERFVISVAEPQPRTVESL